MYTLALIPTSEQRLTLTCAIFLLGRLGDLEFLLDLQQIDAVTELDHVGVAEWRPLAGTDSFLLGILYERRHGAQDVGADLDDDLVTALARSEAAAGATCGKCAFIIITPGRPVLKSHTLIESARR